MRMGGDLATGSVLRGGSVARHLHRKQVIAPSLPSRSPHGDVSPGTGVTRAMPDWPSRGTIYPYFTHGETEAQRGQGAAHSRRSGMITQSKAARHLQISGRPGWRLELSLLEHRSPAEMRCDIP